MDSLAVSAVLVLAAVFGVAGIAKLFDLKGSRQVMDDFGVPRGLAPAAAVALPLAEIATAVLLLVHPTARAGAVLALVLLLAFIAGVANALRHGKDVDCGCFGPIYSATAGTLTLVRNAVLAGLALVVVIHGPGPAVDTWVADRSAAEIAAILLGTVTFVLAVTAWVLWRKVGRTRGSLEHHQDLLADALAKVTPKPEGLPVGAVAPAFSLADNHGGTGTLQTLLAAGNPIVLVFTAPSCGPSNSMVPHLSRWQAGLGGAIELAVIASGNRRANDEAWAGFEQTTLLFDPDDAVAEAYNIRATPVAVAIHPDGRIAGVAFGGMIGVEEVVRLALRRRYPAPEVPQRQSADVLQISQVRPSTA